MEDNKDLVSSTVTEQETSEVQKGEDKKEKMYSRDELYKIVNAEKNKVRDELLKEAETKKSEAERLAKMDAEQKLNYELEQKNKELEDYKKQINSLTLKAEATTYADQKKLPIGYIEDWDYSLETADSVKGKIDKLVSLRSKDVENYLNDKLKQNSPKAVEDSSKKKEDPYLKGYTDYLKKIKH